MEPELIAMMIFTIIIMAMVGGFILLLPVTRRLGQFLEYRMEEKRGLRQDDDRELLIRAVESLRDDVARLAERQDFTERLLKDTRPRIEPGRAEPDA